VTIQGFLIAASSAVLAVQLAGAAQEQSGRSLAAVLFNFIFTLLLGLLLWLQARTAAELHGVIESRAADINHWHEVTMLSENMFEPSQREFTYFKMWQHAQRADVTHLLPRYLAEEGISEAAAKELLGKGLGHTRRVLDVNLFARIGGLCWAIVLTSSAISIWSAVVWWRSLPA